MDSDEDRGSSSSGSEASPARSGSERAGDEPPLPRSVSDVSSFPELMRMAPALQRRAATMSAVELVAVCAAAARFKFYDQALMSAITSSLRECMGKRSGNGLRPGQLVTVLSSLASLNAYDRDLFSAASRTLAREGADRLDPSQRLELLAAFKAVKYDGDVEFIDDLAQKAKEERYEASKEDLFRRQLSKMYGETQDLQGWSVETDRATGQIKKPRIQVTRER